MSSKRIVHCAKARYDVYIGRFASGREVDSYGNPWEVGLHGSRDDVIWLYEQWLRTGEAFGNPRATPERRQWVLDHLVDLKGKTLGCWCAPARCHGEVLLRLLEESQT